jgi:hypothetical protein
MQILSEHCKQKLFKVEVEEIAFLKCLGFHNLHGGESEFLGGGNEVVTDQVI